MKSLIKNTLISMGISMAIFCFVGIVFDISDSGNFSMTDYQFTKMVVGCILVGIGFGVPSIIYNKDNLPMPIKMIIHLGSGSIIYTIVAYSVGWVNHSSSLVYEILILAIQLLVAFVIWLLFMCHYRKEAKIMNEKIQHLKN